MWGDGSSEFGPASPCDIAHDDFLSGTPLSFLTVQPLGWQPGPSNRNMGLGMAKGGAAALRQDGAETVQPQTGISHSLLTLDPSW